MDVASLTTCSGVVFNYTPTGTIVPSGTTYSWNEPSNTGNLNPGAGGTNASSFSGTLTNTGNTVGTATYFVTPNAPGGCTSAGFTVTVSVLPVASISNGTLSTCSGVLFNYTPTGASVPAGVTYGWGIPTMTTSVTNGVAGSNSSSFSGTLTNTNTTVGTATYFVTPNLSSGCTSAGFTVTVNVFPVANISSTSLTTCTGVQFNLTPTGTPVPIGTTYSWGIPTMTGVTNGVGATNASSFSGTLTNSGTTVGTATYFVTPNVPGGCTSAGFTVTVSVFPKANINPASLTTCSGVLFTYTPTGSQVPDGSTYSWSTPSQTGVSNGAAGTNVSSFSGTLTNTNTTAGTATYFVTPNVPGGCTSSMFTITVSVFPVANMNTASLTTCTGVLFTYTPTGSPVPVGTTYTWSTPTINGVTGGAAGSNASSFSGT
jgi:hypothetical protein